MTEIPQQLPSQIHEFHNRANVIYENQFISSLPFKIGKSHLFLYNEIISVKNGSYLKCKIQLHFNIFIYSLRVIPLKVCDRLSSPEEITQASHEVGALQGAHFPHTPTPWLLIVPRSIKSQVKAGPQPDSQSLTIKR